MRRLEKKVYWFVQQVSHFIPYLQPCLEHASILHVRSNVAFTCTPCQPRTGPLESPEAHLDCPVYGSYVLCLGMRHCRVPQSLLKMQPQSAKLAVKLLFKIGISEISEILLKISETLGNAIQLFPQSIAQHCLGSCLPVCQEPSSPTEKRHS